MRKSRTWRGVFGTCTAGLCALTLTGSPAGAEEARKRPNVLIVTTDQQRVDAMSAAGNAWVKTPHMDSIAANGVCFTRSYCLYPLCSPSRTSLHTSRMPHESRVDHNSMPIAPEVPVSGQVFRAAGYDTAYAGKWHMPESYPSDGIPGFEVLNKTSRNRNGTGTPTTAWWRTWTGRSGSCWRPCARPGWRRARLSSSPATTARGSAPTAGPAR